MTKPGALAEEVLASVEMVRPREACAMLGLPTTDPSATLRLYEAKNPILAYDWEGEAAYPRFQFNVAERDVYPALLEVMALRTDDWGGKLALLHWLTRPNRSLGGGRPCDSLAEDGDRILASFSAEIWEPYND